MCECLQPLYASSLRILTLARISMNIGKIEPLQNTPYVAECCKDIEETKEYSSDAYLVFLVRLQFMASTINGSFPLSGIDYWGNLGTGPVWTIVKALQGELDSFQSSLPPELLQSSKLVITSPKWNYFSISLTSNLLTQSKRSSRFISPGCP